MKNIKFTDYILTAALFWMGVSNSSAFEGAVSRDWKNAEWIGFTKGERPGEFAERDLTFNRPPADISSWKPTEKDLKITSRGSFPSPLLRKGFTLTKPIRSAQVSVCGLGLYELYLNGEKVGDRVLDPAQTSYDKRAFYVNHDVTKQVQKGDNVLGLMLGNGFFGQNISFGKGMAYGEPRALLILTVDFQDGTQQTVVSDKDWKAAQGPVLFDNIYLGETYDARLALPDWCRAAFDDSSWKPVEIMKAPTENLVEQEVEPMRKIRAVEPVAVLPAENGDWIIDMGQNMTGWLEIMVKEKAGTPIKMRFAELLMPGGKAIDTASTGIHVTGGDQTDIYVCKGGGVETWEPRFTYHGFRYAQISGLSQKPKVTDFKGWLVRTDMERIGTFECSDPLIQKFYEVSMWTLEDNLQGVLTDCPHRERCGWMGDNHAVGEFASYNLDMQKFWRKASADIETMLGRASPHDEDGLPQDPRAPCNILVGNRLCQQARPDWGAATVLIPWFNYLYYGDLELVQEAWPVMTGWMAYLDDTVQKNGIITQGYGDWCPPNKINQRRVPVPVTSTALYYRQLMVMHQMALGLGKTPEAKENLDKAETVKAAFNAKFYKNGTYGAQTANAMALLFGMVPKGDEKAVGDSLAKLVKENNGYATGIFGHRALYTALDDYGHPDVTKWLWSKTDWPSLGYLTEEHDLTTWPESPSPWDKSKRYNRNSFNHPMHSGFGVAFHESLGGIRPDPEHPGFNHFFLKPCFLPGLEWAKVTHRAPQGLISSAWKRGDGFVSWSVVVPKGSSAQVELPEFKTGQIQLNDGPVKTNTFSLSPGEWTIRVAIGK